MHMGIGVCFYNYPVQTDNRTLSNETQSDDSLLLLSTHHVFVVVTIGATMRLLPRKHVKSGQYRPASKTISEWRFAGGPKVAQDRMMTGSWHAATGHAIDHIQNQTNRNTTSRNKGAQWFSGRVFDSRPRGRGFEPHRRHCVVSLSKNINPS